jgi:hypothetical protein
MYLFGLVLVDDHILVSGQLFEDLTDTIAGPTNRILALLNAESLLRQMNCSERISNVVIEVSHLALSTEDPLIPKPNEVGSN